jgi:hypothetical protein
MIIFDRILPFSDTTTFGRKSIDLMSFSLHIMVMPVGRNVINSNAKNVNNCFEYQHLLLLRGIWWAKF